jgi:16S rRNA (uracil1498-N3)-methyltransferase
MSFSYLLDYYSSIEHNIIMFIPRIYQTNIQQTDQSFSLDTEASHYVTHVLRLKVTDPLILFNGSGGEFHGQIESINKRVTTISIQIYIIKSNESPLHISLGQSICRNDKMDYIIQKSVELGVNSISPLFTKRSEIKLSDNERIDKRVQRWKGIIISACEQCGRNKIPDIHQPENLASWLSSQTPSHKRFILTPDQGKTLADFSDPVSSVSVLIGPESGFENLEVKQAIDNGWEPLSLGSRVLRTETAALAVISALQLKWGDF